MTSFSIFHTNSNWWNDQKGCFHKWIWIITMNEYTHHKNGGILMTLWNDDRKLLKQSHTADKSKKRNGNLLKNRKTNKHVRHTTKQNVGNSFHYLHIKMREKQPFHSVDECVFCFRSLHSNRQKWLLWPPTT